MFEKQQKKMLEQIMSDPKKLQAEVENIRVETSVGGVKVVMRGDQRIENIEIDGVAREDVQKALNKAFKEHQKVVNKKLRKMLLAGVKIPGLR